MKTIFYWVSDHNGSIHMQNPDPFDHSHVDMTYIGYTEKQAQKAFRDYLGLQRKHLEFIKL